MSTTKINNPTAVQLYGESNGQPTSVSVDDAGNLTGSEGLPSNTFQIETSRTIGANQAFADIDLVPIMKLCPDLTAGQLAQPDTDFTNIEVVIFNSSGTFALHIARTALLGTGGDFTVLSDAVNTLQVIYSYSGSTNQRTIALSTPADGVSYQIQVTFSVTAEA